MLYSVYSDSLHTIKSMQSNEEVVFDQNKSSVLALEWELLLNEYAEIFEAPGNPVAHKINHWIELIVPKSSFFAKKIVPYV